MFMVFRVYSYFYLCEYIFLLNVDIIATDVLFLLFFNISKHVFDLSLFKRTHRPKSPTSTSGPSQCLLLGFRCHPDRL